MEKIELEKEEMKGGEEVNHQVNSNFLIGSHIPSIGCFLTLLSFMGYRKQLKGLVKGLNKSKGIYFYKSHVKNSTGFSDKELFTHSSIDIVNIDFNNPLHEQTFKMFRVHNRMKRLNFVFKNAGIGALSLIAN